MIDCMDLSPIMIRQIQTKKMMYFLGKRILERLCLVRMAYWAAIQANQKYTITENVLTRYTSTNFAICGGSLVLVNSKEISLDLRVFTTPPEKHKQMSRIRAISSVHPKGLFSQKIFSLSDTKQIELFISSLSLVNTHYILNDVMKIKDARLILG